MANLWPFSNRLKRNGDKNEEILDLDASSPLLLSSTAFANDTILTDI